MKKEYTKEFLEEACRNSTSYRQVLVLSGRCPDGGGNVKLLKRKIEEFNIDVSHFSHQGWNKGLTKETCPSLKGKEKYTLEEVFTEDSPVTQKTLREYVERHQVIEYKCSFCGNTGVWLDTKISLELDHINGINNDNRIENLRYLCPNCHATTDTYCGKNKKSK